MIANHISLMQFMDGVHQFIIPIFQRDYSWTTKHCKQLWEDVVRAGSDRPFTEKQTMQDGFNDSPLRLNRFIKEQSAWTAKEIEDRGRLLASTACAVWPALVVDHGLVQEAELAELRARAAGFGVDNLEMAPDVRALFDALQKEVVGLGTDVVELFGLKTVTYRVHDFFLEVIPRVNRVILLLNVDPEDCEPLPDQAWDLASSGFVIHATCTEDAGLGYTLKRVKDVPAAMKLVRIAYEKVSG
jgi:predicted transport protein